MAQHEVWWVVLKALRKPRQWMPMLRAALLWLRLAMHHLESAFHSLRVAGRLAKVVAQAYGEDHLTLQAVYIGLLHDVGKVIVPRSVLNKKERLTLEDIALIQRHPAVSAEMAWRAGFDKRVVAVVRSHHECWNGGGYPDGLAGERIPQLARLLSILDAEDVMRHGRCYQQPIPDPKVRKEILRCSRTQFDPDLVAMLFRQTC